VFDTDAASLSTLVPGDRAVVAHVEDEPQVVYAQLVALGVYPGMTVRVEAKNDKRIEVTGDGRRLVLAPLVAENVSVRLIEKDEAPPPTMETLASLAPGEQADVVRLSPACRGLERRRLMDLGIVPGTHVTLERHGLTGGLSAYRVRGTVIGLREEQARMIGIEKRSGTREEPARMESVRTGVLPEETE
jgi:DtxR family Mn-dependent transcriptional regulator